MNTDTITNVNTNSNHDEDCNKPIGNPAGSLSTPRASCLAASLLDFMASKDRQRDLQGLQPPSFQLSLSKEHGYGYTGLNIDVAKDVNIWLK